MTPLPVIEALAAQVACYRRLAKLAEAQHDFIQNARTEELLQVLRDRQTLLDQLSGHEEVVGPVKRNWSQFVTTLDGDSRKRAEELMAESRTLLEQITNADRKDVMTLQQKKLNLGRQINQATAARQVNRNYAAAAYGKVPSRMDVTK